MNTAGLFKIRNNLIQRMNQKHDLMFNCVSNKLDRSYNNYVMDIHKSTNYILSRSNYRVVKALNKYAKEQEELKKKKKKDEEEDFDE